MHFFLMVRDLEGALGKRLWTSGRGLGVDWTHFGAPGDVWERFWDSPTAIWCGGGHLGAVLGAVWMLSGHLGDCTGQCRRKDDNT